MSNLQSLAAAEVRASHRIQCIDAIVPLQLSNMNHRSFTAFVNWVESVMEGRSVAEVVELAKNLNRPVQS